MLRRLSVLAFSALTLAWLSAQPRGQVQTSSASASPVTISGSVVDDALTPIPGVTIRLEHNGHTTATTASDAAGTFRLSVTPGAYRVRAERAGFNPLSRDMQVTGGAQVIRLPLVLVRLGDGRAKGPGGGDTAAGSGGRPNEPVLQPSAPTNATQQERSVSGVASVDSSGRAAPTRPTQSVFVPTPAWRQDFPSAERYAHVPPNRFQRTTEQPLSTFGADVDTASYTNVRRFLSEGQLPPADAVRIEEFVNYFRFAYPEPRGLHPISLTTEIGDCPWAPAHRLVLIGARARASAGSESAGRNIVLLVDVSGSMAPADRLPMLKTAFSMFVDTLRPDDRLAIVTYAGSSGVALPPTPARHREAIQLAIAGLGAGGSTNGGQGLLVAYRLAREAFVPGGVNRVILATDGDFNVGVTSQDELVRVIEREKSSGVFLSVLGVGTGNLKDSTMELLADKGNGHYAYLDSLQEARRVLVREGASTLETVAKDVKFQVEFNPALVSAWKLIGYENRTMAAEHFNDDRKDGGEVGAGHTVTVLYEVVPAGVSPDDGGGNDRPRVDPLRYQPSVSPITTPSARPRDPRDLGGEWLTVKVRYQQPEGDISQLITQPVRMTGRVQHLPFAAAVAEFGLLLREGSGRASRWDALARRTSSLSVPASLATDRDGFVELVEIARGMAGR